MAGLRGATPVPLLARMLLLTVLLGGIVTMHAVAVNVGHVSSPAVIAVDHHAGGATDSGHPRKGDDCGGHSGLHSCVFVMTAISALAGLTLLWWVGHSRATPVIRRLSRRLGRRERAPPWTVLTLSKLSILRV